MLCMIYIILITLNKGVCMGMKLMNEVTKIKDSVDNESIYFVSRMKIKQDEGLLYLYLTNGDILIRVLNFFN